MKAVYWGWSGFVFRFFLFLLFLAFLFFFCGRGTVLVNDRENS